MRKKYLALVMSILMAIMMTATPVVATTETDTTDLVTTTEETTEDATTELPDEETDATEEFVTAAPEPLLQSVSLDYTIVEILEPSSEGFKLAKFTNGDFTFVRLNNEPAWLDQYSNPKRFQQASLFSEGLARVQIGYDPNGIWVGETHFIDANGLTVHGPFADADSFSEGLARVKLIGAPTQSAVNFIDHDGVVQFPNNFTAAGRFSEGLCPVMFANNSYGFIDRYNSTRFVTQNYSGESFSEGLAVIRFSNGLYGYADRMGNEVFPFRFTYAKSFSEGLAAVQIQGSSHYVYIDKSGVAQVDNELTSALPFENGRARISYYDIDHGVTVYAYIRHDGNIVS